MFTDRVIDVSRLNETVNDFLDKVSNVEEDLDIDDDYIEGALDQVSSRIISDHSSSDLSFGGDALANNVFVHNPDPPRKVIPGFTDPLLVDWEQRWCDHGYRNIADAIEWSLATLDDPALANKMTRLGFNLSDAGEVVFRMKSRKMFTVTDHLGITDDVLGILLSVPDIKDFQRGRGFDTIRSVLTLHRTIPLDIMLRLIDRIPQLDDSSVVIMICMNKPDWMTSVEDVDTVTEASFVAMIRHRLFIRLNAIRSDEAYFTISKYLSDNIDSADQFVGELIRLDTALDQTLSPEEMFSVVISDDAGVPFSWITGQDVARSLNPDMYDQLVEHYENDLRTSPDFLSQLRDRFLAEVDSLENQK